MNACQHGQNRVGRSNLSPERLSAQIEKYRVLRSLKGSRVRITECSFDKKLIGQTGLCDETFGTGLIHVFLDDLPYRVTLNYLQVEKE